MRNIYKFTLKATLIVAFAAVAGYGVLLTSCNQSRSGNWEDWEQSFTVSQKLKSVPCMDEELILGGPVQMLYMDSSLLIHDVKTENLFWLIDVADKYKICLL